MMKPTILKTKEQIDKIREAGKYTNELLTLIQDYCKPWVALEDVDFFANHYLSSRNLKSAFKWYQWYPGYTCLSVNDCVVHGIPDRYVLKPWDLLKIDMWIDYKWWISDSAVSIVIWWFAANKKGAQLIDSTKNALDNALQYITIWNTVQDFGRAVYDTVRKDGFRIIKQLTWHWVGAKVHEWPYIYNRPAPGTQYIAFEENMVLALEPITALKSEKIFTKGRNNWNLYTQYGDIWAQREYTVWINSNGYEILSGLI